MTHLLTTLRARLPLPLWGGVRGLREPPLVPPQLPLLGDALRFGRDAGAFLAGLRAQHGDVFTTLIAGKRMTFVLDPHDATRVLKETADLRFRDLAAEISARAFDHSLEILQCTDPAEIHRLFNVHLKGEALPPLSARMGEALLREVPASGEGDLYELVSRWLFQAGVAVLWGDVPAGAGPARDDFLRLDAAFPLLISGVPAALLGLGAARRRLRERAAQLHAHASGLLRARRAYFERSGASAADQGGAMLALLWAAQANTIPAAFWTVAHVLADAAAREAVLGELAGAALPPDEELLGGLPLLDSAIKEALRLTTGSLVLRQATRDMELVLESGAWRLRAGDRVCLYPYLTHHDAEVFPEPERFVYDRFLARGGPAQFFKGGRRLTTPLMPYGGGVSMCPGRFLAHQEIKIFAVCLLRSLQVELLQPLPGLLQRRAGLGILPPQRELRARWRRSS